MLLLWETDVTECYGVVKKLLNRAISFSFFYPSLQKRIQGIHFLPCCKISQPLSKSFFSKQSFEKSYLFPLTNECNFTATAEKRIPNIGVLECQGKNTMQAWCFYP